MPERTSSLAQLRAIRKQLFACLPAGMAERMASGVTPYILEISEDHAELYRDGRQLGEMQLGGSVFDPSIASLLKPHEHPLTVFVPVNWLLKRTVALPAAAQENLRQVISFELDRFTPFPADQVYFDYHINSRGGGAEMLSVDVALVPCKRVDDWLNALRLAGIAVDTLSASGLWDEANLLPPELRPKLNLRRLTQKMLPVALVVILLAAAMALPLWQKRNIAMSLQAREAVLRGKAGEVIKLREKVDAEIQSLEKIRDQWRAFPPVLDVLQVLTNLLPDDTSLQRMEVKGNTLTINGTSSSASSLIALLQNSPAFDAPHFLSPVTQQRGKEVFNLAARIQMPFPRDLDSVAVADEGSTTMPAAKGAAPAPVAKPGKEAAPVETTSAPSAGGAAVQPGLEPETTAAPVAEPAPLPPPVSYSTDTGRSRTLPAAPSVPPQRTISGAGR
ncbi:PilN domain-containing protein [Thiolapillus sp.]|uniref:PilN domain-containing protein n=1 Tax=Thiolapillus sp. TaxID=2017437 RepID=UPI0026013C3A